MAFDGDSDDDGDSGDNDGDGDSGDNSDNGDGDDSDTIGGTTALEDVLYIGKEREDEHGDKLVDGTKEAGDNTRELPFVHGATERIAAVRLTKPWLRKRSFDPAECEENLAKTCVDLGVIQCCLTGNLEQECLALLLMATTRP
mmetsp:Transcript_20767/g.29026  ORF Transcript_20767/g.29026 Transcript_20767/m.29026 type:complete len:143 (+) Transcript_20767:460-888(+)